MTERLKSVISHNSQGDKMPNITLSIPEELHRFVKQHNEIRWSEIARRAIMQEAGRIIEVEKIVKKSKLKESDVDEIDHMIKKKIYERYHK